MRISCNGNIVHAETKRVSHSKSSRAHKPELEVDRTDTLRCESEKRKSSHILSPVHQHVGGTPLATNQSVSPRVLFVCLCHTEQTRQAVCHLPVFE